GHVGVNFLGRFVEVAFARDVVVLEDAARFVAADLHRDALRNTRADEIANACSTEIVKRQPDVLQLARLIAKRAAFLFVCRLVEALAAAYATDPLAMSQFGAQARIDPRLPDAGDGPRRTRGEHVSRSRATLLFACEHWREFAHERNRARFFVLGRPCA